MEMRTSKFSKLILKFVELSNLLKGKFNRV